MRRVRRLPGQAQEFNGFADGPGAFGAVRVAQLCSQIHIMISPAYKGDKVCDYEGGHTVHSHG